MKPPSSLLAARWFSDRRFAIQSSDSSAGALCIAVTTAPATGFPSRVRIEPVHDAAGSSRTSTVEGAPGTIVRCCVSADRYPDAETSIEYWPGSSGGA
jgi:hypothetical protein